MPRHTLSACSSAMHLIALRNSNALVMRSNNLEMSERPVTRNLPSDAAASALTALR